MTINHMVAPHVQALIIDAETIKSIVNKLVKKDKHMVEPSIHDHLLFIKASDLLTLGPDFEQINSAI